MPRKRNSHLLLALQTLGHMAADPERLRTSVDIANNAGTNAVVVRRVLGKLRETGLFASEKGHAGAGITSARRSKSRLRMFFWLWTKALWQQGARRTLQTVGLKTSCSKRLPPFGTTLNAALLNVWQAPKSLR